MDEAAWFFTQLYRHQPEGTRIALWSLPSKRTAFAENPTNAARKAMQLAKDDVYCAVCLMRPGVRRGRGTVEDVVAVPALWADIDYGTCHKKNVPPTEEEARTVLDHVGLRPSILVRSGHGYHAYWLLDECHLLSCEAEREEYQTLCLRWSRTVCAVAHGYGYELDVVGDLARVLRVPGTVNRKDPACPVPVTIVSDRATEPLRYRLDDFDPWLMAPEVESTSAGAAAGGAPERIIVAALHLDWRATIGAEELSVLRDNLGKPFRLTWDYQRGDFPSPSEYDMALAAFLVNAGWSDQRVADALIHFRREVVAPRLPNDAERLRSQRKIMRRDYIQRAIAKARYARQSAAAADEIGEALPIDGSAPEHVQDDPQDRQRMAWIAKLQKALGIPLVRWVQHGVEHEQYAMILEDGTDVPMGNVASVTSQTNFFNNVYRATRKPIPTFTRPRWRNVLFALGAIVEVVAREELTRRGMLIEWLTAYVRGEKVFGPDTWEGAIDHGYPFVQDGCLHVAIDELQQHIHYTRGDRVEPKVLYEMLRVIGAKSISKTYRDADGVPKGRRYWKVPGAGTEDILRMGGKPQLPHESDTPPVLDFAGGGDEAEEADHVGR